MTFSNNADTASADNQAIKSTAVKKQRGHVAPRRPIIDINSPGRLRTGEVMALCAFSHSSLYLRIKNGSFPAPDGSDGRNYWNTSTIKNYLGEDQSC